MTVELLVSAAAIAHWIANWTPKATAKIMKDEKTINTIPQAIPAMFHFLADWANLMACSG